jgi:hypothetical protein
MWNSNSEYWLEAVTSTPKISYTWWARPTQQSNIETLKMFFSRQKQSLYFFLLKHLLTGGGEDYVTQHPFF